MAENFLGAGSQSSLDRGIQIWELELNAKLGSIFRELEIYEDDEYLYIFYQNHRVGEISCTWRKYTDWWKRPELHETADFDDVDPKNYFQKLVDDDDTPDTSQLPVTWEKGVAKHEVEGLNFVTPKRFFHTIFGTGENIQFWLLQNFCNFCLLGLNQAYEKDLIFKLTRGAFKGKIKTIRVTANEWNLALLGQVQTTVFTGGNELLTSEDHSISNYSEISICKFNHDGNYNVNLYILKKGQVTTHDNLQEKLYCSSNLTESHTFYSNGVPAQVQVK